MLVEGHYNPSISFHVLVVQFIQIIVHQLTSMHNRDAARYTFGTLLQTQLKNFVTEWNNHRIRQSKMAETPSGIPNVLFKFSELQGINYYHYNKCIIKIT